VIPNEVLYTAYAVLSVYVARKIIVRLRLSKAKHPSVTGHAKWSRRLAGWIHSYSFDDGNFFSSDNPPPDISQTRRLAFARIAKAARDKSPQSIAMSEELEHSVSDVLFTNSYRVPFPYANYVRQHIKLGGIVSESSAVQVKDLDGNWSYDLSGSYGVNVFGYDVYKKCIEDGMQRVKQLGPVLGPYHPIIADNVERLKRISGMDEVSFHMSGTEAVMQAVRLARYHTRRSHLVRFCGAYHGWWDGVQPGIGDRRRVNDVYTLKDMNKDTLKVLRTRKDIACILINPTQAMHPNSNAPSDSMLFGSGRKAGFNRDAYSRWLRQLREVCDERGIVMIMDEVFVGFRLAYGGAQEYFGVKADIVTYGKTLGGGLPIGVVCGKHRLMKRFNPKRPLDICFARGTFNSHPYVMASMNEFLKYIDSAEAQSIYEQADILWQSRADSLNQALKAHDLPIRVVNLMSIWTIIFTQPSRYNWMLQFYLRAQGLNISWIGSGRFIMSHNYSNEDFQQVLQRIVTAADNMKRDNWWWRDTSLHAKSIQNLLLRELISTRFS